MEKGEKKDVFVDRQKIKGRERKTKRKNFVLRNSNGKTRQLVNSEAFVPEKRGASG